MELTGGEDPWLEGPSVAVPSADDAQRLALELDAACGRSGDVQVFFAAEGKPFTAEQSAWLSRSDAAGGAYRGVVPLLGQRMRFRLDPPGSEGRVCLHALRARPLVPLATLACLAVPALLARSADEAELLVLSRDPELGYRRLAQALQVLLRGGGFLALNLDMRVPMAGGRIVPGNGAIAAALSAASGVTPESVGKPAPFYFEVALERFGMQRESTVMVGDNLDSDVQGGRNAGLRTVQVGGSTFSALTPPPEPDLSLTGLPQLGELLGLAPVLRP